MTESKLGVSRRTLAKGAAWSAPVVAIGGNAPAFAASPGTTGRFRVNWGNQELSSWQSSRTFTATSINSTCTANPITYTVSITSQMQAGEATSHNFTIGTQGMYFPGDACHRINYDGSLVTFAQQNLLVLNQSGYHQSGSSDASDCSTSGVVPKQLLTFTVTDPNGKVVATTNCDFWVQDISSYEGDLGHWAWRYWDAVNFPNNADTTTDGQGHASDGSIVSGTSLTRLSGTGPYNLDTPGTYSSSKGVNWYHAFRMPSGVPGQMIYTQANNQWGGQFIGIRNIEFDAPCG